MAQSYFEPGENRAARVRELFGRIAARYDLINDLQSFWLHRLWKRRVISLARLRAGERALDICCGTGDLAIALARRGALVTGLDFTPAMLEVARSRAVRGGAPRPLWVQGDALRLPFGDQEFDIVTIAYGLRNLADWQAGIAEIFRVTKQAGRILILEFSKPKNVVLRVFYMGYLGVVVPALGKVFCGDSRAYAYILESLERYPRQDVIAERLKALGCSSVQMFNVLGGTMCIHTATR